MSLPANYSARIPKETLYAIVILAYSEGIGARRLSTLVGYSYTHLRLIAREMGCPKLPRYVPYSVPSVKLLGLISSVSHLRIAKREIAEPNNARDTAP